MDFSLLAPDDEFDIADYKAQIVDELGAFGLDVSFETREKKVASRVESAFLKAKIGAAVPANQTIRVKLEIDTDPPLRLAHLEARMRQSGNYLESSPLADDIFAKILHDRIDHIDVDSARDDARRFVPISYDISIWSRELFHAAASKMRTC